MSNKGVKITYVLVVSLVLAGCGTSAKKDDLAIEPVAGKITVPSEFATQAIDKTGGLEAWGMVTKLQLDCVVTFFDKDAGYYLTEQKCSVYPWSNSIVISGKESQADYVWQLSQGKFKVLKGIGQSEGFKNQISSACFEECILGLVTAPVRFLDKSDVYTRETTAVNLQGRWCYPITVEEAKVSKSKSSANSMTLYQNRSGMMVDMLLLTCDKSDNASYLVCGYDYKEIKNGSVSYPTRIEIHLAGKDGFSQRQLFRIEVTPSK